jgi:CheY-like chemotaxis protein
MPSRVLLADDHDDGREMIAHTLREAGHDVIEVGDGLAAMSQLTSMMLLNQTPDIIITDVFMPGASGLMVVSGLRAMGYRQRVILVTAYDSEEVRQRAKALDVEILAKPLDLDALRERVGQLEQ